MHTWSSSEILSEGDHFQDLGADGSTYLLTYLLTYSMEQSPSWEANRFAANQEIPHIFMELQGSLPHSQVPATCPYSEPALSSPYPQHLTSWISILILSTHLLLGLPNSLLSSGFPTKTLFLFPCIAYNFFLARRPPSGSWPPHSRGF